MSPDEIIGNPDYKCYWVSKESKEYNPHTPDYIVKDGELWGINSWKENVPEGTVEYLRWDNCWHYIEDCIE